MKNFLIGFALFAILAVSSASIYMNWVLWQEHENVYNLLQASNRITYSMQDTMVRIFHYAKPHKDPVYSCPECDAIMKDALGIPQQIKVNRNF